MEACCSLCYEKYINADGTINEEAARAVLAKRKRSAMGLTEKRAKRWARTQPPDTAPLPKLCRCECHIIGTYMLH